MKYAVITLDLESDYAGHARERYDAWSNRYVDELLAFLKRHNVPLTVFVVGKTLAAYPGIIKRFQEYNSEFHLHSYSHDLSAPDSADEIEKGIRAYKLFFGKKPVGYRAPEGRISETGWRILIEKGFLFDSSIFPSFWPRPWYLKYQRQPFIVPGTALKEIPFTTVSSFRLIVALSWIKLLGWRFYKACIHIFGLPDVVVFNIHLHDFWLLPSYKTLPLHWRLVYGRNHSKSFEYFVQFVNFIRNKGYTFTTISSVGV